MSLVALGGVVLGFEGAGVERYLGAVGSTYVPGELHETDVTPELWRRVALELRTQDNATAHIVVLRPLWWIEEAGIFEGGTIDLEVVEAGLAGSARVVSVTADVGIDSRTAGAGFGIVIGTIRHADARVVRLVFNGDEESPLQVTPNHPLYSASRGEFVPAGDLVVGERLRVADLGIAVLTARYDER